MVNKNKAYQFSTRSKVDQKQRMVNKNELINFQLDQK